MRRVCDRQEDPLPRPSNAPATPKDRGNRGSRVVARRASMGENRNSSSSSSRSSQFYAPSQNFKPVPSHSGICLRASQLCRRRANNPHPGPAAETIRGYLLGLSSTRTRLRPVCHAATVEFIRFWGYLVFLVYCMRRVNCKQCGVVVEEVPWAVGKPSSTKVYMHFLGHWARKLSWKETAEEFRTSWDKVHDA